MFGTYLSLRLGNYMTTILMILRLFETYSAVGYRSLFTFRTTTAKLSGLSNSLTGFYRLNDLMWQDGLLIDFLQKKVTDKWIRRFLVYSSYLVSERLIFEVVVRFYIDFVVWPSTMRSVFDFVNVSLTLAALIGTLVAVVLLFNLHYLYIIIL